MLIKRLIAAAGIIAAAAISAAILLANSGNHAGPRRPNTLPPCTPGYTLTPSQVAGTGSPYPGSGLETIANSARPGTVICLSAGDDQTAVRGRTAHLYSISDASNPLVIRPAPGATVEGPCWNLSNVYGLRIEGFTGPSEVGGALPIQGSANISFNHNVIGWCPTNVIAQKNSNIVFSYNTIDNYSPNGIITNPTSEPDFQVTSSSPPVCPQGVVLTHNTVLGYAPRDTRGPNGPKGNPDGFDLSGHDCGDQFTYNYIRGLSQGTDANANHTDAFQDLAGSGPDNLIRGNWMDGVPDCFLGDDNVRGLTYADNVCSVASYASYYAQCGGCVADHFDHNTFITTGSTATPAIYGLSHPADGSLASSDLEWTNNLQLSPWNRPGASTRSNPSTLTCSPLACTIDYNFEATAVGSHDVTSGTVSFTGGPTPSSFAGYALSCPTSPGCGAGSDGKNMGADDLSVTPGSGIPGP